VPRDLGDVIHYFIPEAADPATAGDVAAPPSPPSPERAVAATVIGLPHEPGDVLRAAFAWNLAVELARRGAPVALVVPPEEDAPSLWPEAGRGPLGAELVVAEGSGGSALAAAARAHAQTLGAGDPPAIVLAGVPSEALAPTAAAPGAPQRWLLFSSPDAADLRAARERAHAIAAVQPAARIGLTIHAVARIADAEAAFDRFVDQTQPALDAPITSYGMLVDDLHVYRAIVARRPIGLAHPQAPAARALGDVARLLLEDAAGDRTQ